METRAGVTMGGHSAGEDSDRWAFSESGPWRVERARVTWLADLDGVRRAAQSEVPALTRPRLMPPVVRFGEAFRSVGGALAVWWLRERRGGGEISRAGLSRRLREAFEHLGSAYIKLGQIVSSGRGLFPDELVHEFKKCRDQVPPEPFESVRRVIEEDLGTSLEDVFAQFDRECLASASIAQVHRATLRTGEEVVVKVQRPGVAVRVRRDIAAMAWIAPKLVGRIPVAALANPPALVELFAETIVEELDFRLEAQNMLDVAQVLREAGQKAIVVPRPHPELVTPRVLVMERLEGFSYDDVKGMQAAGIDTAEVLRSMLISVLEGAMIYGVFHGDLHGGNLFVMRDGRVALLDYGITARMDEVQRSAFLRMMMSGAANDVKGQLAAFRDLGALDADADLDELVGILKLDQPVRDPTRMSGEEIASEISQILKGLLGKGARLPKALMLYAKSMLFFDGAVAELAPDLDMFSEVVRIYAYFATNHSQAIAAQIGFDPSQSALDLTGMKASLGLEGDAASLTHRELQKRRQIIQKKLEESGAGLPGLELGK